MKRPIGGKGNAARRRTARRSEFGDRRSRGKAIGRKRFRQGPRPFAPIPDERLGAERLLDKFGVANRLAVKPNTVSMWANKGRLPAYRIGAYLRFKWSEVEGWLAETSRVRSAKRGVQNGDQAEKTFRHLTPALSPIEAERERILKPKTTGEK